MKNKKKTIIISSVSAFLLIVGILVYIIGSGRILPTAIRTNNVWLTNLALSGSAVSDSKLLQVLAADGINLSTEMSGVVAQNCIGNTKRYDSLRYISAVVSTPIRINGDLAVFQCFTAKQADWTAASILLSNLKTFDVKGASGKSLLETSLTAAQQADAATAKDYFDTLLSKTLPQFYDKTTMEQLLSVPSITDAQVQSILSNQNYKLNTQYADMLAQIILAKHLHYSALAYMSSKLGESFTIQGMNVIFYCLAASTPNWEAATTLVPTLKDADIQNSSEVCLLSYSIMAAKNTESSQISAYFKALLSKKLDFMKVDSDGNTPLHYALKYENTSVMNSLFAYINARDIEDGLDGSSELRMYSTNNKGQLPWEYANTDISNAVQCMVSCSWTAAALESAKYASNKDHISTAACLKAADAGEKLLSTYENAGDYSSAEKYCSDAVDLLSYANQKTADSTEKASIEAKLKSLNATYDDLVAKATVCYDARRREIAVGNRVHFRIDDYEFDATVTALSANNQITVQVDAANMMQQIYIYTQADGNARLSNNYSDATYQAEKQKLFEQYPYGKTVTINAATCTIV